MGSYDKFKLIYYNDWTKKRVSVFNIYLQK